MHVNFCRNVFITGAAGTGKTFLLKVLKIALLNKILLYFNFFLLVLIQEILRILPVHTTYTTASRYIYIYIYIYIYTYFFKEEETS